ncbi:MAG: endonuclease/exonuclease/phosphatase family protein [Anaerolineae bacterium]|nr:endonuclease/exonuclease/phosphatase family protein [Anaerolineae bacterium]
MQRSEVLRQPSATARSRRARPEPRSPWLGALVGLMTAYALLLISYRLADVLADLTLTFNLQSSIANWLGLISTFEPLFLLPLLPCLVLALVCRARLAGALLALAALPFVLFYAPLFLPHSAAPSAPQSLKVMTHNILAANQQSDRLAEAIVAEAPDVVALQELVANHATRLAPRLSQVYPYRVIYRDQGLGLYSRYPLREAQLLTLAPESSFAIRAILDAPGGPITVFNAHPRNPRIDWSSWGGSLFYVANFDPTRRDRAVTALAQAIERTQGPVLVLGDLNLPDRSAAYRLLTRELRDGHRDAGWGLGYTFPVARPGGPLGFLFPVLRIDYVLYSSDLRALETRLGAPTGSDHRPVIARLAMVNK